MSSRTSNCAVVDTGYSLWKWLFGAGAHLRSVASLTLTATISAVLASMLIVKCAYLG